MTTIVLKNKTIEAQAQSAHCIKLRILLSMGFFLILMSIGLYPVSIVSAFEVSPVRLEFSPDGNSAQNLRIRNTQAEPIAVELSVFERPSFAAPNEQTASAADAFIITPPQLVLTPGGGQVVRVRWIGGPLQTESAFTLVVRQLPIDFNPTTDDGVAINVAFEYEVATYVTPRGATAAFEATFAQRSLDAEGNARLTVVLENTGSRRGFLGDGSISVQTTSGQSFTLDDDALAPYRGGLLLSGARTRLSFPWPSGVSGDVASFSSDLTANLL